MKTPLFMLAALIGLACLTAPATSRAETLICEGDSQTAVRSPVTDAQTYCAIVAAALGWDHTNLAVAGSKASDVVARLPTELASTPGACVLVMIGANDAYIDPYAYNAAASAPPQWTAPLDPPASRTSLTDFEAQLVTIVDEIRGAGKAPVLITPWAVWSSAELTQYQFYVQRMKDVGARLSVPVVDAWSIAPDLYWNLRDAIATSRFVDYQHENAAGHADIAALFRLQRYQAACAYHP
jgi:lysophospholipase L1-like esterase